MGVVAQPLGIPALLQISMPTNKQRSCWVSQQAAGSHGPCHGLPTSSRLTRAVTRWQGRRGAVTSFRVTGGSYRGIVLTNEFAIGAKYLVLASNLARMNPTASRNLLKTIPPLCDPVSRPRYQTQYVVFFQNVCKKTNKQSFSISNKQYKHRT